MDHPPTGVFFTLLNDCFFNIWLVVTGCHFLNVHIHIGLLIALIIPIDVHIFQRGGPTTNQIWMIEKHNCFLHYDSQPLLLMSSTYFLAFSVCSQTVWKQSGIIHVVSWRFAAIPSDVELSWGFCGTCNCFGDVTTRRARFASDSHLAVAQTVAPNSGPQTKGTVKTISNAIGWRLSIYLSPGWPDLQIIFLKVLLLVFEDTQYLHISIHCQFKSVTVLFVVNHFYYIRLYKSFKSYTSHAMLYTMQHTRCLWQQVKKCLMWESVSTFHGGPSHSGSGY